MSPVFDPAAALAWLRILHGDAPGHVSIVSTTDWAGRAFPTNHLDQAVAYAAQLDAAGAEGIYARVTTLTTPPPPGKRAGAADSASLPALWADIDIAGPGHKEQDLPPTPQAGQDIIAATGFPEPTIWIHSGGGLYPIWLLEKPYPLTSTGDPAEDGPGGIDGAKRLAKDWQRVIEHAAASLGWRYGRGVGDLARVLRLPGSINRKEGLARPCRITWATPARYTYLELADILATALSKIAPPDPGIAAPAENLLPSTNRTGDGLQPGHDLNARGDWAQILEPAGWRVHYRNDDITYWTRPGKSTGISASTNALGTDRIHVFTTSGSPLEGGESYSKFGAYAALNFAGDHQAAARALGRQGYGDPLPDPAQQQAEMLANLLPPPQPAAAPVQEPPAPEATAGPRLWAPEVNVSNTAEAADWLREQLGRGRLAGYFDRDDRIVHTPTEGEDGYHPLTTTGGDEDGPAQIRPVTDSQLASRITYTHGVYKLVKRGDGHIPTQALFPRDAARLPIDTPDLMPHLRHLAGVVHTPTLRPDGTLLTAPGYDPTTRLLHLPEPGLTVPAVPEQPTTGHVRQAVTLLEEMVAGFPFVTPHHRANYLGLLFTPLLRALAPSPWKLGAIEAHQPGSGKSLLAQILRIIHGGVVRTEMPTDDTELSKQLAAILMVTTGPVVTWDNVSGAVRSSALAGLLTERTLSDRPLGVTDFRTFVNDRLWTITGNNMILGGDLTRRTIGIMIDPGIPQPEKRTNFAILDLPQWVRGKRGELLHALLVVIRRWVLDGQPKIIGSSDGYAKWIGSVRGILATAGIGGEFDHKDTTRDGVGADDEEWRDFLTTIRSVMGEREWTVKELLGYVSDGNLLSQAPITLDDLPEELATKAARNGISSISRSLGWWLRNRDGRWAGSVCVRAVAGSNVKTWKVFTMEGQPS